MFQVPKLKVRRLSWGEGSASPAGLSEGRPQALFGPADWADGRTGENSLRLRRAVGAPGAPVDAWRREVSRGWLPEAPTAPTPAGGVPAVLPPSPSCPVPLSGVTTACAGREVASLYCMRCVHQVEERGSLRGRIAPGPRRVRSCGGQHQGSEVGSPKTRWHQSPGGVSERETEAVKVTAGQARRRRSREAEYIIRKQGQSRRGQEGTVQRQGAQAHRGRGKQAERAGSRQGTQGYGGGISRYGK